MREYLKVKIMSLAAEARIIRRLENQAKRRMRAAQARPEWAADAEHQRDVWLGLKHHRRYDVREENRASHLAYGFLRGTAYKTMEAKCHERPNWARVEKLVQKYGGFRVGDNYPERFAEWRKA